MQRSLTVHLDSTTKTLYITGNGDISWKDTVVFSEVTEHIVIEGDGVYCTNASNLFANFTQLVDIEGFIDTKDCKDMSYFYSGCAKLIKPITNLDTRSAEEFDFFHNDNHSLTSVKFNSTHNGFKFLKMFYHCDLLTNIEGISIPSTYDFNTVSDNSIVIGLLSGNFKESIING